MKQVAILGSTGSIGTTTLKVIQQHKKEFNLHALTVHNNVRGLNAQIAKFRPSKVAISNKKARGKIVLGKVSRCSVLSGVEALNEIASDKKVDIVVIALSGVSALGPLLAAIAAGKHIALANKEALVAAGGIIMERLRQSKATLIPVDSEQSAIFQCLEGRDKKALRTIYLTASGGSLRDVPPRRFKHLRVKEILKHPRWKMGKKISIDSATLMNKGLEVIEAHHLFGVKINNIEVLIHPEAVIHSMVEFIDGSILAHMGRCDMRSPIQYALTYPARSASPVKELNFSKFRPLEFCLPDFKKFPCLEMAYEAATRGGTAPAVLNGSNEIAVEEFLKRRINFTDIPRVIGKVMGFHRNVKDPALKDILEADKWARIKTKEILDAIGR